jgi:transcriptional regulator with XRE-family HTH domain
MSAAHQQATFLQSVGLRIKPLRKEKGYTLADLGDNIGLDKSNVYRLESGKNFTIETLIKIAGSLDVHPKELLDAPYYIDLKQIEKAIDDKRKRRSASNIKSGIHDAQQRVATFIFTELVLRSLNGIFRQRSPLVVRPPANRLSIT